MMSHEPANTHVSFCTLSNTLYKYTIKYIITVLQVNFSGTMCKMKRLGPRMKS